MTFLKNVWGAVKAAVVAVPGGMATVLPIVVALASRYGFHVSVTSLTVIMSVASAVVGYLVHLGVKSQVKKATVKQ